MHALTADRVKELEDAYGTRALVEKRAERRRDESDRYAEWTEEGPDRLARWTSRRSEPPADALGIFDL